VKRLVTCILLTVVACHNGNQSDGYVLDEWSVEGPGHLSAASNAVAVLNSGEWSHTLVITTETGHVVAASGLIESGTSAVLETPLEPGEYVFSCRIVAQDDHGELSDHYQQGMSRRVIVEA
jgi:hypothetical protein